MTESDPKFPPGHAPEPRPTPPPSLPEMPEAQATRQQRPSDRTRVLQPAAPDMDRPDKPKRQQLPRGSVVTHPRQENPLAIPLWLVALMLMGVVAAVVLILGVVVLLGGTPALEKPPRVVILTAALTPQAVDESSAALASATIPAQYDVAPAPLALQGPTLVPVAITPTLEGIAVGKSVLVAAEQTGLNIRSVPGTTDSTILFVAPPGQSFVVTEGPLQADGLTWWKVQNPVDPNQSGWAAAAFLSVVPGS